MSLHSLKTKSFDCHICSKVFTHAVGLNIHFRAHFNQNIYICCFCQKIFSKQCLLLEHLQSHKESKLFSCDECHKVFPYQVALNVHRQSHTKKDILSSAISTANKRFLADDEIENRNSSSLTHKSQLFGNCSGYTSENEIENTESSFMTDKSQLYENCSGYTSFENEIENTESSMILKPQLYENYSDYTSSENEESFELNMLPDSSLNLNTFQNDEEILQCHFTQDIKRPLIFKVSQNKDIVYDFSQETPDKKVYFCNVCKKEFFTQNGLDNHSCKLGDKEKFVCDICNATFPLKTILYSHRHSHKRFRCKFCMKEFSNSQKFLYHTNSHEKPFKCIICEKGFTAKMHLDDHLRMHTNEKPFECEECLATFSQKSHLNRHLRMHEKRSFTFHRKSTW